MLTKNNPSYDFFKEELKKIARLDLVLDLGTSSRFAKEIADFKPYFKDNYFALGYDPEICESDSDCDIDGDIASLPIKNTCVDGVICLEVLEHVTDPFKAVDEIYRILKPKGQVLLSVPFLAPYHGKSLLNQNFSHDSYPDFWRFTHQGLEQLFYKFKKVKIIPVTNTLAYYVYDVFPGSIIPLLKSKPVQTLVNKLMKKQAPCSTRRHIIVAQK